MKYYLLWIWIMVLSLTSLWFGSPVHAEGIGMVTGSKAGTYIRFGQDIATVAQTVGLEIIVKESEGSIDNIRRLVSRENAAWAIVQSDVLGFLRRSDDAEIRRIAERLRLVFPFYNEEVHLFAHQEIQRFEDLTGKRVVVGTKGSGNWLTANNLLRLMNIQPAERIEIPPPEGVSAVLTREADAMFYVAGKPVKIFSNIRELHTDPQFANLAKGMHFVPLTHEKMVQEYVASSITPGDYPWLEATVQTVAVKSMLISFDFSSKQTPYYRERCTQLGKLSQAIRANFAALQQSGHPKWKEVDLDQEVGSWERDTCAQPSKPVRREPTKDEILEILINTLKKR
jgi:hypothetical protein